MTTKGHHGHLLNARSAHSKMGPFFIIEGERDFARQVPFSHTAGLWGLVSFLINLPMVCVRSQAAAEHLLVVSHFEVASFPQRHHVSSGKTLQRGVEETLRK